MRAQRIIVTFLLVMCGFWARSAQLERNRDSWQQPEKVMDVIGVKPGMTIGEVGAGEGYFTFKLARRVGETGRIYANDIDQRALKSIEDRCKRENIRNIIPILGEVERPLLPEGGMDMVIMVYVLHDLAKPVELLRNVPPALKPDAPLVVLERDPEKAGDHSGHFFSKERILKIFDQAGYELIRTETFLPRDNIHILRPRSLTRETEKFSDHGHLCRRPL